MGHPMEGARMGRIQTLKPALRVVDVAIGSAPRRNLDYSDPRRGSRHDRGYGTEWDRLRALILKRDGYRCLACQRAGRATAATHVDHITERADGGSEDPKNLQSLCPPCHAAKSAAERARRRGFGDGPAWPLIPGGEGQSSG